MYQGRHSNPRKKRVFKMNKRLVALLSVAVVLCAVIGGTVAYLMTNTDPVNNTFLPSKVECEVQKSGNAYSVKNIGDIDAYIRVTIVANWMDASGNVYWKQPTYSVSCDTKDDWFAGYDGFYYHKADVQPNGFTLSGFEVALGEDETAPTGYTFTVEVLAEAIQSVPDAAAESAWPVDANNGTLAPLN